MLLKFSGSNFKAFHEQFVFDMHPQKRVNELKYSLLSEKINGRANRALSTSVIYGPNAAGKTSLINAMSCLRQIVLRGNIRDAENDRTFDHVSCEMDLIPFIKSRNEPVSFSVEFTHNGRKYLYSLIINIGDFLSQSTERYIQNEQLWINDNQIFERCRDSVCKLDISSVKGMLNAGYDDADTAQVMDTMSRNISHESLLLITDFNSFCSKKIVNEITEWFSKRFITLNSSDRHRFTPAFTADTGTAMIHEDINNIAKTAGIIGSDFAYAVTSENGKPRLMSVIENKDNKVSGIDADKIESVGTLRLVSIMPAIMQALQNGATIVMDEFDASLHPSIVKNIISIFHNDEVNVNKAQIIFNTQNPIYLDNRLMRRDEIKFVEKEEDGAAQLYSLSDFRTPDGKLSVRNTSDYMKNYFVSRYGAIIDIDFTDIVRDMLARKETDK